MVAWFDYIFTIKIPKETFPWTEASKPLRGTMAIIMLLPLFANHNLPWKRSLLSRSVVMIILYEMIVFILSWDMFFYLHLSPKHLGGGSVYRCSLTLSHVRILSLCSKDDKVCFLLFTRTALYKEISLSTALWNTIFFFIDLNEVMIILAFGGCRFLWLRTVKAMYCINLVWRDDVVNGQSFYTLNITALEDWYLLICNTRI